MYTRKNFWIYPFLLIGYGLVCLVLAVWRTHSLLDHLSYLVIMWLGFEILGYRAAILDWREGRGDRVLKAELERRRRKLGER